MLIIFIAFSNVSTFSLTIRQNMCDIICAEKNPKQGNVKHWRGLQQQSSPA